MWRPSGVQAKEDERSYPDERHRTSHNRPSWLRRMDRAGEWPKTADAFAPDHLSGSLRHRSRGKCCALTEDAAYGENPQVGILGFGQVVNGAVSTGGGDREKMRENPFTTERGQELAGPAEGLARQFSGCAFALFLRREPCVRRKIGSRSVLEKVEANYCQPSLSIPNGSSYKPKY